MTARKIERTLGGVKRGDDLLTILVAVAPRLQRISPMQ